MDASNNVFRGTSAVADFFDPDKNPPLPLVEIPDRLNPYRQDGVRIYAKMLTHLPAQNVKSLPVGTGGCITGTASYLKSQKPSCRILGVFNVFGDPTPGPRHFQGFNTCGFPWTQNVDTFVEVPSTDSFRMSMKLTREGLIAGPSSGQALKGLLDHIGQLKEAGTIAELADPTTGEVSCVFTYSYRCDQARHDERWILEPAQAAAMLRLNDPPELLPPHKDETTISSASLDSSIQATHLPATPTTLTNRPPTLWSTLQILPRRASSTPTTPQTTPNHHNHQQPTTPP
ncbi:hypothetical protein CHGG_00177 [Chaetomium globosum CBS 148.51]|uniref:Tryptophan synthase beta chain-like PALP domain-containing protein n=1 Tax=Chaetomium globosum (strain ATCC 6205 / CBS 148.51 / DSM 1962 / NBRC 6347 / NRRL 1970) TaxID=306901 RepID=Q2HHX7_CHAGB|nr:uncharacterized protein CHGG_00177 [Chaetomium globosum CBS 148.51]EAQ91942.1 hypothetical protein CHGG_00177 [Chaetomium globosum CBS 148.51]